MVDLAAGLAGALLALGLATALWPGRDGTGSPDPGALVRAGWQRRRALGAAAAAMLLTGLLALGATGLPALGLAGAAVGFGILRGTAGLAARDRRRRRQDEILEAVRMLRQLLEAGGVGVQQGLAALAERGPRGLRREFTEVVAAASAGRQAEAWAATRRRLGEPLYDLLSTAIQVQRPSGGRLAPLFGELEEAVTAIYEVARESEALQVQARSAALLIVCLPMVFLLALSALHSPYLAPYREFRGELFLGVMLSLMGGSYAWILRSLRLPAELESGLRSVDA